MKLKGSGEIQEELEGGERGKGTPGLLLNQNLFITVRRVHLPRTQYQPTTCELRVPMSTSSLEAGILQLLSPSCGSYTFAPSCTMFPEPEALRVLGFS